MKEDRKEERWKGGGGTQNQSKLWPGRTNGRTSMRRTRRTGHQEMRLPIILALKLKER